MLLLLGLAWRRRRLWVWGAALALLLLAPWPSPQIVLTEAVPTSFHRSPTGFDAAAIERGLALYRAQCLACHGADGRGEGPLAAAQPVWPPTLSAGLMWKRAEGELFWRVLHGLHGRDGTLTMAGFAGRLSDDEVWAVLDGMKALSAGESAAREAGWPWPVRAPGFSVECQGLARRTLAQWRGQRLRIVAAGPMQPAPAEDPRLLTVMLRPQGETAPAGADGCNVASAQSQQAWRAYASVAGVPPQALAGTQFIVDREGWLRAMSRPGAGGWSEDDLLCRAEPAQSRSVARPDGLDALITRMDKEVIVIARLGLPHAR